MTMSGRTCCTALAVLVGVTIVPHPASARQEPFVLTPLLGAATVETVARWVEQAKQHEPGEWDAAADWAFTRSQRELAGVLDAIHRGRLMIDRRDVDTVLARGAILHTDIAAAQMRAGERADRASTGGLATLHFGMASGIVRVLGARPATDAFVRSWQVAVAAILGQRKEVNLAPVFIDRAVRDYPRDPQLLLLAGAVRELRATPRVQDATDLGVTLGSVGTASDNLRRAEALFRRAAASAPLQVEARVRLGRVLVLSGRPSEGLAELRGAAADAASVLEAGSRLDPEILYFLSLFTGEAAEAVGRLAEARAAYARAEVLYPGAVAPLLDLSRLELRAGNRGAAASAILRMSRPASDDLDEPWRDYPRAGPARHVSEMLAVLAAAIPGRQ
jgi:hypothetical protein